MKTKKYLVSTLLASTLVIAAAGLSPAGADEKTLSPQGSWSISKVDRTAQGGNSYCTLSRKYEDNVILSLGRNMAEEYSLALDFQKDIFDKDKAVKINLQPGPGKLRAYDLLPASSKAVVVRLGWDEGFFETLNKSQKMNVKIGNDSYAFAMPLIAKGQADLEDCMDNLKSASKGPGPATVIPSKDVLSAEPTQTSKAFDAGRLNAQTEAAKVDVAAQEQKVLRDFAASIEEQEQEGGVAKKSNFNKSQPKQEAPVKMATKEPLDITAKPAAAIAAIEPAAGEITPAEPTKAAPPVVAVDNSSEIAALEKRIQQMNAENSALKDKADSGNKDKEQLAAFQKQIGDLMTENSNLKTQAEAAPKINTQLSALEKRVADLSMENAALLAKAGGAEQTNAQLAQLQKQVSDLASENASLKQKTAEAAAAAPKPAEVASMAKSIQDLTARSADAEKKIADLTAENNSYKSKASVPVTSLPQDVAKIAALEKQIESLMTENADKSQSAASAVTAVDGAKFTSLEKRISELTTENNSLKQATANAGDATTSKAKVLELEAKNKILQDRIDSIALENSQKPDAAQVSDMQEKVKELQIKNAQLEETVRASQTRIAETAVNTETRSLKSIADLEVKLEAAQKDNIALSKELETIKEGAGDARLTLASGNWDLEKATKRYNESEKENRRLGLALEQAKMSCNTEKSKIEQMLFDPAVADQKQIDRLTQLETELEAAKAQLAGRSPDAVPVPSVEISSISDAGWQAEKAQLLSRIAALESDDKFTGISALPDSGAERDAKVLAAQQQVQNVNSQNAALRAEMDKLRAQIADANSNGSIRADRVAAAQLEADRLKRENEFKNNQTMTYQNQIVTLREENNKLKSQQASDRGVVTIPSQPSAIPMPPRPHAEKSDRSASSATELASIQPTAGGASTGGYDATTLKTLLQKAGVSASGMERASRGLSGAQNYKWSGQNGVRGASAVKTVNSPAEFDGLVKQYIAVQKADCGGDFASIPTQEASGGKKVALYETACVGGSQSASASTVFFMDQGRFVAISSQAAADQMGSAMDSRDKIASMVGGL